MEALKRHFLIFILVGIVCYSVLVLLAQGETFYTALKAISVQRIPFLLALASMNYMLRYLRWEMYLRTLGITLNPWISFKIFMAGLAMTVTPGKVGEALKAYLLKNQIERPWSLGLPIVFAERLIDLMGVIVLVAMGLWVVPVGRNLATAGMIICLLLVVISANSSIFSFVARIIGKLPRMERISQKLLDMHTSIRSLFKTRILIIAIMLSCIAWFAECWIIYFVLLPFNADVTWLHATFVYSVSTLAGALSILPGGLAATEASMTGLLISFGLQGGQAALVTIVVRICTLWYAVFLGMLFLALIQRDGSQACKRAA